MEEKMSEIKKQKIAVEIIYYLKRIPICIFLFFVYYWGFYNEIYNKYAYEYSIHTKDWFLGKYIKLYDFIDILIHILFVLIILLILFHRQIFSYYNWLKKYS